MIREICIVGVMLVVAAGAYLLSVQADMPRAYIFPKTVITVMVVMALIQLTESIIMAKKIRAGMANQNAVAFPWKNVTMAFVCAVVYFASMESVGFYFSGFLFFLITTTLLQKEKITFKSSAMRAATGGVFMAVLFLLFHVILAVQTPKGLVM